MQFLIKKISTGLQESQATGSPVKYVAVSDENLVSVVPLSQTRHFSDNLASAAFLENILTVSLSRSSDQSPPLTPFTDVIVNVAAPHVLFVSMNFAVQCVIICKY